jgi:hypothetical protein
MIAIVSGAVCILAGVARLGFVTELLSKPIRYGYMNGIALAVLVSQTPKLVGVKVEKAGPGHLVDRRRDRWRKNELDRIRFGRGYARGDLLEQDLQGPAWHPSRGRGRDGNRTGF